MQPSDLDTTLNLLGAGVKPWRSSNLTFIRTLQDAVRNHGHVQLMESTEHDVSESAVRFAVKKVPNKWMRLSPRDFETKYPESSERPWYDMAFVKHLNSMGFAHVCSFIGIFADEQHTYLTLELCDDGDLFSWCDREPSRPGLEREDVIRPFAKQLFSAVRFIHNVGIAHRDLSLENVLLTSAADGGQLIKIIDFGMATLERFPLNERRGKKSYQAPEMHLTSMRYDAFLSDVFAVGVTVFCMSVKDYPWMATMPNACQLFRFVCQHGLMKLFQKRKLREGKGEYLSQVLSPSLMDFLSAVLALMPLDRATCGEACYQEAGEARRSAWDLQWLQAADVAIGALANEGEIREVDAFANESEIGA
jgi:serine/threonine protein kinase